MCLTLSLSKFELEVFILSFKSNESYIGNLYQEMLETPEFPSRKVKNWKFLEIKDIDELMLDENKVENQP